MDGNGNGQDGDSFAKLPRDCLIHLLSFTTPRDLCRSAVLSKSFQSAAESDAAWENFLPPDCAVILSQAVHPVEFFTKKELYLRLCQPILLQDGQMSFQLERATGKKTYMISAKKLEIEWVNDPRYWTWISLPESRFDQVAKLKKVSWLSIAGSISSQLLSRKTLYEVYIVFKLADGAHHLNVPTQVGSINLGNYVSEKRITLLLEEEDEDDHDDNDNDEADNDEAERDAPRPRDLPRLRDDGWLDVSLGEFYNYEGNEGDVEMSLRELQDQYWKYGLILLGFEVRPKETSMLE